MQQDVTSDLTVPVIMSTFRNLEHMDLSGIKNRQFLQMGTVLSTGRMTERASAVGLRVPKKPNVDIVAIKIIIFLK